MQDQVMALSRLKIPLFFAYDVVHGQRTVFPISLGLASSFNLDAVRTVGRVSAYEAADDGLNMTWAPMVDVSREPRWGARLRRLRRRHLPDLYHGRNHGESDAG
ncbi:beta-glucosidase [Salmonella enterica subsp. arizonae]|uniref:beta-glucosidase n=1 Tax=Salmonella enterica subsp. arizonae TaxID=59203 RepID=A0A379S076_SALER|nr:beta-glucosidase [Salmonella enterica subsp. arizonae]